MLPSQPEAWPAAFDQELGARDLDAVMALYAPDARFVGPAGDVAVGRDAIREVLAGLIRTNTRLHSRVARSIVVDDIAMLYTDFEGTTRDATGRTIDVQFHAIEILRRQSDGTWLLIVGDPAGRAPRPGTLA